MIFTKYPYHVYMVRCADRSLYTGITNDLERRLMQHNGKMWGGARYTRAKGPVELVYIEKYETRSDASKREYQIKHSLNHAQKEELVASISKEDILKAI